MRLGEVGAGCAGKCARSDPVPLPPEPSALIGAARGAASQCVAVRRSLRLGRAGRRVARNRFSARLSPPPIAAHGDAGTAGTAGTESQFFVCSSRRGLCLTAGRGGAGSFLRPSPRLDVTNWTLGTLAQGDGRGWRAQVVSFLCGSGNRSHRFRISPRDVSFVLTGRHYPAVGRGDAAVAHRGGCLYPRSGLGQGSSRALPGLCQQGQDRESRASELDRHGR